MSDRFPTWMNQEVRTIGDLVRTLAAIIDKGDPEEAQAFRHEYQRVNEHADANIGYCLGYLAHDSMVAGLRMFSVSHPVFGGPVTAAAVTPEGAFEAGKAIGKAIRPGN